MDMTIFKESKVHLGVLAKILKASRVTVSLWINGKAEPSAMRLKRVERMKRVVQSAVNAGDLPPKGIRRSELAAYSKDVLIEHAKRIA